MIRRVFHSMPVLFLCYAAWAESTNLPPISVWDYSAEVAVGAGYRNNVLQSSVVNENSWFLLSSVDASLMRLSEADSIFMLYMFYEDIRYSDAPSVDTEQIFSTSAQYTRPLGDRNEAGVELNYLYQHQIFDASVDETDLQRVLVRGHSVTLTPHFTHELGRGWETRLEGELFRQMYETDLDDYWEGGLQAELARSYGHRSEVSIWYSPLLRSYDTRNQYDRDGFSEPGTDLTYFQNEVGSEWRHHWDEARQWRTTSRLSYLLSEDNGSGYYDYNRLYFRQQLRWKNDHWMIRGTARFGWYDYPNQRFLSETRDRSYVTLGFRVERELGEHWMLFFDGEHEWNNSNDPLDEYRTWVTSGGVGYAF